MNIKFSSYIPFFIFIGISLIFVPKLFLDKKDNLIMKSNTLNDMNNLKIISIITNDQIDFIEKKDEYIYVYFFSENCFNCINSFKALENIKNQFKIKIIGLSVSFSSTDLFFKIKNYHMILDDIGIITNQVAQKLNINEVPEFRVYKNGFLVRIIKGLIDEEELVTILKETDKEVLGENKKLS
ncbi:MAG: thiol-disulfide isomerase/thioredoxin [Candidatus Midichloriaceae bacterium]|jgi:thiol-disulfide isomerase/thioredoxin